MNKQTKTLSTELGTYKPLEPAINELTMGGWEITHVISSPVHVAWASTYSIATGKPILTVILQKDME